MEKTLDLRGLSCPIPLMRTRDAVANAAGLDSLTIVVDEPPAKENIVKYLKANYDKVECKEAGGEYIISVCMQNKTR